MIKSFQVTQEGSAFSFPLRGPPIHYPGLRNPGGHKDPWITYILLTSEIVFQSLPLINLLYIFGILYLEYVGQ